MPRHGPPGNPHNLPVDFSRKPRQDTVPGRAVNRRSAATGTRNAAARSGRGVPSNTTTTTTQKTTPTSTTRKTTVKRAHDGLSVGRSGGSGATGYTR
jgi:hypothetical protein